MNPVSDPSPSSNFRIYENSAFSFTISTFLSSPLILLTFSISSAILVATFTSYFLSAPFSFWIPAFCYSNDWSTSLQTPPSPIISSRVLLSTLRHASLFLYAFISVRHCLPYYLNNLLFLSFFRFLMSLFTQFFFLHFLLQIFEFLLISSFLLMNFIY
jgi:hypothetical protein